MIKKPMTNCRPIGRDIEFNNPFVNSNKRHYWDYGEGNLGFLTTEQLQTLRKLKFRQGKSNLSIYEDYSTAKTNIPHNFNEIIIGESKHHTMSQKNIQIAQRMPQIISKIQAEVIQPKQPNQNNFKRHKSNISCYKIQPQTLIQPTQKHKYQSKSIIKPAGRQSHLYRKLNSSRKIMFHEFHPQQTNPQEINYTYRSSNRSSLQQKNQYKLQNLNKRKSQMKLQSGTLQKNLRQDSFTRSQKDLKKDKFIRIETEPSTKRQNKEMQKLGQSTEEHIKLNELTTNKEEISNLYKNRKYLLPKDRFIKLRRDHSPTFCNSIEYPLSYYRHV